MLVLDRDMTVIKLNRIFKASGKTVKDIQNACGFSTVGSVYKWLSGESLPTVDNLVILAHECGVTVDDILATKEV